MYICIYMHIYIYIYVYIYIANTCCASCQSCRWTIGRWSWCCLDLGRLPPHAHTHTYKKIHTQARTHTHMRTHTHTHAHTNIIARANVPADVTCERRTVITHQSTTFTRAHGRAHAELWICGTYLRHHRWSGGRDARPFPPWPACLDCVS